MIPIDLPPGVVNIAAKTKKTANWREVNLVRWDNATMRPVGGWEAVDYTPFASRHRASHKWIANDGRMYIAHLCEEHCYVDEGTSLIDITPVGGIEPPPTVGVGGYGDLKYSDSTYGTPRSGRSRQLTFTPCYTLDNWGEELRAMTSSDGRLLRWSPTTPATPLVAVVNAPISNRSFCVTPERHIILFGAGGNQARFEWSDEEDDTEWTPGITSKAGGFTVEPNAPIVAHKVGTAGILMFTNRTAYIIRHVGLPYIYGYEKVIDCPVPVSAAAIIEIPDGIFWAAHNGFWIYNGISVAPILCPIWDWIKTGFNLDATKYEATIVNASAKSEAWYFFASGDSAVNNRLAIYNYRDKVWSMGRIGRTCGVSYPNEESPYMSDGVTVWKHEVGSNYPDSAENVWAETFTMNVMEGSTDMTIKQLMPEVVGNPDVIRFSFAKVQNRASNGLETYSPQRPVRSNGYVDIRETARDFRMRVEQVAEGDWTLGQINVDAVRRGKER